MRTTAAPPIAIPAIAPEESLELEPEAGASIPEVGGGAEEDVGAGCGEVDGAGAGGGAELPLAVRSWYAAQSGLGSARGQFVAWHRESS